MKFSEEKKELSSTRRLAHVRIRQSLGVLVLLAALCPNNAIAALMTFTGQADFMAAISGFSDIRTLDFDGMSPGTNLPNGSETGGIIFTYTIPETILVDDTFETTSGNNYLGLDNADRAFIFGDSFTMTFDRVVRAVGLYVISEEPLFQGDFELKTSAGSALSSGTPDVLLTDGAAYFMGLVQSDPAMAFSTAQLISDSGNFGGDFLFNADDITTAIPEPGSLALLSTGVLALILRKRAKSI